MHESFLTLLDRRFVSSFYDVYESAAHDAEAVSWVKRAKLLHGDSIQYGGVFTPEGEMLISFGFDRLEVYLALRYALLERPEFDWLTGEEERVFTRAEAEPDDAGAQLAAAELALELSLFDEAATRLDALLTGELEPAERNHALYLRGRIGLLDLANPDADAMRAAFGAMEDPPPELALGATLDAVWPTLARREGMFFTGWEFAEGVDLEALEGQLSGWLERAAASPRVGELRFLLGLARMQRGDRAGAKAIWSEHVERFPNDRYALVSRLHHPSYRFSPFGRTKIGGNSKGGDGAGVPWLVERLAEHGVRVSAR